MNYSLSLFSFGFFSFNKARIQSLFKTLLFFIFIFSGFNVYSTSCVTVTSITCSNCVAGVIDNDPGPVTTTFCVSINQAETGSNWIHGAFVNGSPAGFNMATMTGSGVPGGWDGVGAWLYMPAPAFTSANSGNLITQAGWYNDRSADGDPGNNIGDNGVGDPSPHTFCFAITAKSCAVLGAISTPGTISFGFTSDSYSGAWTDNTCGIETPATSFAYSLDCCPVIANAGTDVTLCGGASTTLDASASQNETTYAWSNGATTATTTVTPAVTTTYTVTVGNGTCTDTDDIIVTVDNLSVDAGPDQTICPSTVSTPLGGTYSNPLLITQTFTNSTVVAIPDQGNVNSTIASTLAGGIITQICLDIDHIWNEDLDIRLTCPGGTTIDVSSDNGASGDNYNNVCFTRTAGLNINTTSGVITNITGNWLPEQSLATLDACASNGNWVLNVADDAMFISGTLNTWNITIQPPVTILWSPATNLSSTSVLNPTFTNPGPGTYTYTLSVTDSKCTVTNDVIITVIGPILSSVITNTSCTGNTGAVNLTVASGTSPFTYVWSNAATTEDISLLAAGTYTVTVTDAKSCTATLSNVVVAPGAPTLSSVLTHINCNGAATGAIDLTVTGGTSPFTYTWSSGPVTQDLSSIIAGTYTVTVTDNNLCTATHSATLTQNTAITITPTLVTNVLCPCEATGAIDITVAGGVPGYTYLWSNAATTEDLTGLTGPSYTVTVTDTKSCTKTTSIAVTSPSAITIALVSSVTPTCNGVCNGTATFQASGGTGPYDYSNTGGAAYQFNNQAGNVTYPGLCSGAITITVRDANNCVTPP